MDELLQSLRNRADAITDTGALFLGLTSFTVGLRIVFRPLLKIRLGMDDVFLVAALILFWVETALNLQGRFVHPAKILRAQRNCV